MALMLRAAVWSLALCAAMPTTPSAVMAGSPYARRHVWDRFSGGQLNISSFAFRDINRNGTYDMADQPMAGIAFAASGGGRTVTRRTNKSGFGNFTMSVVRRDQDLVNRGEYTFEAAVPPGWLVTTENAAQTTRLETMPGAPGDMVSSAPMQPVGFAPELTIAGQVAFGAEPGGRRISIGAISPRGERRAIEIDQAGSFAFAASPGLWTIQAGAAGVEREVEVTVAPVRLAAIEVDEPSPSREPAGVTVGFDDLVSAGIKEIPSGYRGLSWRNWVATHQKFYDGEGYPNTTLSGEFVAYNSSGHPVTISRERPFDFIGGYFGSAWLRAEGETLRVKGWRGDRLVHEAQVSLSALGPVYLAAEFRDITRLDLATDRYWQFVADDLAFRLPDR